MRIIKNHRGIIPLLVKMYTNKPDPIIEKILLTEEHKQEIRDVMEGKTRTIHERHYKPVGALNDRLKKMRVKYFKGGKCIICHNFPSHRVIYKLDYGSVIEYYCQEHLDKSDIIK